MVYVALALYGAAFVCFLAVAGRAKTRINPLGLGLLCLALLWFLQVLVPQVS